MLAIYPMMEALSPTLKKAGKIAGGIAGTGLAGYYAYKHKDDIGAATKKISQTAKDIFSKKEDNNLTSGGESSSTPEVKPSTSNLELKSSHQTTTTPDSKKETFELKRGSLEAKNNLPGGNEDKKLAPLAPISNEEKKDLEKAKQKASKLKENMDKSRRDPRDIEAERKANQLNKNQIQREKTTRDNMGIIPKKPSWWARIKTADKKYAEERNAKLDQN